MDPNPRKALRRKGLESESRKRSGKRSGMSVRAVFPFLHIYIVCVHVCARACNGWGIQRFQCWIRLSLALEYSWFSQIEKQRIICVCVPLHKCSHFNCRFLNEGWTMLCWYVCICISGCKYSPGLATVYQRTPLNIWTLLFMPSYQINPHSIPLNADNADLHGSCQPLRAWLTRITKGAANRENMKY